MDHIYTSAQDRLGQVGVRDVTSSDHSIITFTRTLNSNMTKKQITIRNYRNFKEDKFLLELKQKKWQDITDDMDVNTATEMLSKFVMNTLENHAPLSKITVRENYIQGISIETKDTIKNREEAFHKCKRTKNEEDIKKWKKLRN